MHWHPVKSPLGDVCAFCWRSLLCPCMCGEEGVPTHKACARVLSLPSGIAPPASACHSGVTLRRMRLGRALGRRRRQSRAGCAQNGSALDNHGRQEQRRQQGDRLVAPARASARCELSAVGLLWPAPSSQGRVAVVRVVPDFCRARAPTERRTVAAWGSGSTSRALQHTQTRPNAASTVRAAGARSAATAGGHAPEAREVPPSRVNDHSARFGPPRGSNALGAAREGGSGAPPGETPKAWSPRLWLESAFRKARSRRLPRRFRVRRTRIPRSGACRAWALPRPGRQGGSRSNSALCEAISVRWGVAQVKKTRCHRVCQAVHPWHGHTERKPATSAGGALTWCCPFAGKRSRLSGRQAGATAAACRFGRLKACSRRSSARSALPPPVDPQSWSPTRDAMTREPSPIPPLVLRPGACRRQRCCFCGARPTPDAPHAAGLRPRRRRRATAPLPSLRSASRARPHPPPHTTRLTGCQRRVPERPGSCASVLGSLSPPGLCAGRRKLRMSGARL